MSKPPYSPNNLPANRGPSGWRARFAVVAILALAGPVYEGMRSSQLNVHRAQRLYREHRLSPDMYPDDLFRRLIPHIPAAGVISFSAATASQTERARLHYRLQYALAPRIVELGQRRQFVVVDAPHESLPRDQFVLVRQFDDFRLYRRIP